MAKALKRVRDVVVVEGTEGRNPFEVLMLAWAVLSSAYFLFVATPPGAIIEDLPNWVVTAWYILLCIGGSVALVGVWLKSLILSLLVERAAMLIVSSSGLLYSVALFSLSNSPPRVFGTTSVVLMFALSAFIRFVRINVYLREVRKRFRALAEAVTES